MNIADFLGEQKKVFMNLCKKYNKFMSGGTDYHAENKPYITIGTGIDNNLNIDKSFISNWIEKVMFI